MDTLILATLIQLLSYVDLYAQNNSELMGYFENNYMGVFENKTYLTTPITAIRVNYIREEKQISFNFPEDNFITYREISKIGSKYFEDDVIFNDLKTQLIVLLRHKYL